MTSQTTNRAPANMNKNRWLLLIAWLVLIAGLIFYLWWQWPADQLQLVFCDIGQGDAILLTYGRSQILIDGGPDDQVMDCLGEHLPFWDRQLELVVATHADADHITGLTSVLNHYQVSTLLITPWGKPTQTFANLVTAIENELDEPVGKSKSVVKPPILGQTMVFPLEKGPNFGPWWLWWWPTRSTPPDLTLTVVSPRVEDVATQLQWTQFAETGLSVVDDYFVTDLESSVDLNDRSIVLFLEYGQFQALLTGDLEASGEQALLEQGLIGEVEVLKVGHHGAKTSTSSQFLARLRPEISVISVGQNNRYGHPAPVVMTRLTEFDSQIVRTDQSGTIEIVTDGDEYWLSTER